MQSKLLAKVAEYRTVIKSGSESNERAFRGIQDLIIIPRTKLVLRLRVYDEISAWYEYN